ncbi:MAG: hypothetical protein L0Z48_05435 [candidate division Zixibacteria bacterium]|nr:hypothetical protein [candidate division Zixibacteria bacterium]
MFARLGVACSFRPDRPLYQVPCHLNNRKQTMKTSNISIFSVPVLVAGSIALSGCGQRSAANPTKISYSQVGVCKSYATLTAKPNEGFVVFKIETIDNAKQNSPFHLDPERLLVDQTTAEFQQKDISRRSRRFINPDPRFVQAMGVKGLARAAFPANEKTDVNSFVIVPLPLDIGLGGPNAKQYSFDLVYDTTTTEVQVGSNEVVTTKTNAAVAEYPVVENCKELAYK